MKNLEELGVELCVFELRYSPNPLLWDAVGSIWSSVVAANPSLEVALVQPNQQVFETDSLQLTLDISILRVAARGDNALEDVTKNASLLLKIVAEKLRFQSFKRAGLRIIRSNEFETSDRALKAANLPGDDESPALGKEALKVGFVRNTRFETDKAGLIASLRVEERETTFSVPWESRPYLPTKLKRKTWVLVSDLDYYTVGTIDRETFDVETWVRQAVRTMQRQWSTV